MFHDDPYIQLFKQILSVVPALRIYLLAVVDLPVDEGEETGKGCQIENRTHYFVLVLVREAASENNHAIRAKIENACQAMGIVSAMVQEAEKFKEAVACGQPFACNVIENATTYFEDMGFKIDNGSIATE
jgi:hypothetical protein